MEPVLRLHRNRSRPPFKPFDWQVVLASVLTRRAPTYE